MEGYVGEIRMFAGNFAPRDWAYCQGQTVSLRTNTALFSILGTVYGGDGSTTFGLPDLRGRSAIGVGNGLSTYTLGQSGGFENLPLTITTMPVHTHTATFAAGGGTLTSTFKASVNAATQNVPGTSGANVLAAMQSTDLSPITIKEYVNDSAPAVPIVGLTVTQGTGTAGSGTVTNVPNGQSVPLSMMQPFLVMSYVICTSGTFPSRN